MKLWQKNSQAKVNELVEKFTVGNDYILDMQIIEYDIQASIAHAKGLNKIGILTDIEFDKVNQALQNLTLRLKAREIEISLADEDCHTFIESYLTKELGDLGKKIHTGRSRNDQVLVALQLYIQHNGAAIFQATQDLSEKFSALSIKNTDIPFPGYSHTQQAMVTSLGHYFASFAESLKDDAKFLENILGLISKNPLGSAAGFGVNLPLDRNLTTKELGFKTIQINSLYCQNSRGKFQSAYLEALSQIMLTLGNFAEDMIMYTTKEFAYFKVADEFTTGSSIMPQKKNQDVLELVRGYVSVVIADQINIKMLAKSLPSGYNKDFQLMKAPLLNATQVVVDCLEIIFGFLDGIEPDVEQITAKLSHEILSADIATELAAKEGIPFRDAYKIAMENLPKGEIDWPKEFKKHISLGAAGNLN